MDTPNDSSDNSSNVDVMESDQAAPFLLPFKFGWRRELVERSTERRPGQKCSDVYYITPDRFKMRSLKDIEAYLAKKGVDDVTMANFTFRKQLVGAGLPHERQRKAAGHKSVSTAAGGTKLVSASKTNAQVHIRRPLKTVPIASSVIKLQDEERFRRHATSQRFSLMEKSRRAFAHKAMELKKKVPVQVARRATVGKMAGRPRTVGAARNVVMRRPWQLTMVDCETAEVMSVRPPDPEIAIDYLRLVRAAVRPHTHTQTLVGRRRVLPCSLFCFWKDQQQPPATSCVQSSATSCIQLPAIQCLVCRCLFHADCVGLQPPLQQQQPLHNFICLICYAGMESGPALPTLGEMTALPRIGDHQLMADHSAGDSEESAGESDGGAQELSSHTLSLSPSVFEPSRSSMHTMHEAPSQPDTVQHDNSAWPRLTSGDDVTAAASPPLRHPIRGAGDSRGLRRVGRGRCRGRGRGWTPLQRHRTAITVTASRKRSWVADT